MERHDNDKESVYRFVVCVDVCGNDLDDAYRNLRRAMDCTERGMGSVWEGYETSDEAFAPDGEPIAETELSAMRMRVLTQEEECGSK